MKNYTLATMVIFTFLSCKTQKATTSTSNNLEGIWELNYISGPRIAFEGLYPSRKPIINFEGEMVSGNNGCNSFSGKLINNGNKVNFKDSKLRTTLMACEGEGESVFMTTLNKVNTYAVSPDGKTLTFIMGDIAVMRFNKK